MLTFLLILVIMIPSRAEITMTEQEYEDEKWYKEFKKSNRS